MAILWVKKVPLLCGSQIRLHFSGWMPEGPVFYKFIVFLKVRAFSLASLRYNISILRQAPHFIFIIHQLREMN